MDIRNFIGIVGGLAVLVLFQTTAFAEMIYGEVASLNPRASSLTVRGIDSDTGEIGEIKISVPYDTEFKGVRSLTELDTGDKVLIDATMNEILGGLEANVIDAAKDPNNLL